MNNPQEIELKPCPFCGGDDLRKQVFPQDFIVCKRCGTQGPLGGVDAWSNRNIINLGSLISTVKDCLYREGIFFDEESASEMASDLAKNIFNLLNGEGNDE